MEGEGMELENKKSTRVTTRNTSDVFLSWSGSNSKEIAKALKHMFETKVFANEKIRCFVSDEDIASGTDWWNKIKKELKSCKIGIICITKENINAPWIYFEAGAMVARGVPSVIPLLINCDFNVLKETPLNTSHAVNFYEFSKFTKMVCDINEAMGYSGKTNDDIAILMKEYYGQLKDDLDQVLMTLRDLRVFNKKYVYPNNVQAVRRNTIFISAPMSSIDSDEYNKLRRCLLRVKELLQNIGFTEIYCPIIEKDDPAHFDGRTRAIRDNFPNMKRAESMLVIYPRNLPSSSLVENGYGIALSKRMVIFHRENLPYILAEAGGEIQNIKTYSFKEYNEIEEIIEANGMTIFDGGYDD
jgi:hypothetical protein